MDRVHRGMVITFTQKSLSCDLPNICDVDGEFDQLAMRRRVFKIETIGDCCKSNILGA